MLLVVLWATAEVQEGQIWGETTKGRMEPGSGQQGRTGSK